MFLKRRLAAFAAVIAALAVGTSTGLASAATTAATAPVVTGPSCPDGYNGPTNLATGCPWWMMTYTVQNPTPETAAIDQPLAGLEYWGASDRLPGDLLLMLPAPRVGATP
jgi:hypothetical protein